MILPPLSTCLATKNPLVKTFRPAELPQGAPISARNSKSFDYCLIDGLPWTPRGAATDSAGLWTRAGNPGI